MVLLSSNRFRISICLVQIVCVRQFANALFGRWFRRLRLENILYPMKEGGMDCYMIRRNGCTFEGGEYVLFLFSGDELIFFNMVWMS